jgi:lauroyl/myristoyl acyltransferase
MKIVRLQDLHDLLSLAWPQSGGPWSQLNELLATLQGRLDYLFRPSVRRLTRQRISRAMGDQLTASDVHQLTRRLLYEGDVGREIVFLRRFVSREPGLMRALQRVHIDGLEHLEAALGRGKGVILWEMPFGKRLRAKAVLIHRGFRLIQLHARSHGASYSWVGQNVIRKIHRRLAAGLYADLLEMNRESIYLRRVLERLRRNEIICMQGWGGAGRKFVSVNFLGTPYHFATGAARMAQRSGAALIPMVCFRDHANEHQLMLGEPVQLERMGNADASLIAAVTHYARLLESFVRRYPDQWGGWRRPPAIADPWATVLDAESLPRAVENSRPAENSRAKENSPAAENSRSASPTA